MADNRSGSSGWLGFIAGIIVVALIGVAIYEYAGAGRSQQTAQLELSVPQVQTPDVHLPSPTPAPVTPPQAG